jgi:predicted phosphoribosyltransferase/alpha-beta hydrolase superfamily lysophospholipase
VLFTNRDEAGRQLGARLEHLAGQDVVVLGLPRGGVPVAAAVAAALDAPLDLCLVRKLGVPTQPELAMGAIGENGVRVTDDMIVRQAHVAPQALARVEERERRELARRAELYRGGRPPLAVAGRTVVVVDDGVATGSTARAACRTVRARGAVRTVLAVPVAPPDWTARLADEADELVCLATPSAFFAVGQFYADFGQLDDEDVTACLRQAAVAGGRGHAGRGHAGHLRMDQEVQVAAGAVRLGGRLTIPEDPAGIVLFAHGSGSGRFSPRNRFVAEGLNRAGLGTLLFDLLTEEEAGDRANVFDTGLLAERLADATDWLHGLPGIEGLAVGYFGASTGAAAALWAAAEPGARIAALASRGARPDLAGPRLADVSAPTLLVVGGADLTVLDLNRQARARLHCESRLTVVPGATHLFQEPGALESVTELACDWFTDHMAPAHV